MTDNLLAYTSDGPTDAPTLLLGHALGSERSMWDQVVPRLANSFRVIRYEFPGHGKSAVPDSAPPLSPVQMRGYLVDLLDRLKLDSVHLAGLSLGGMVSLSLAETIPDRVRSLAMFSSGPVLLPASAWTEKAALVREKGLSTLADATMQRWFTSDFSTGKGAAAVQDTKERFLATTAEGYARCCELISALDARPDFNKLRCPVLLAPGEFDAGTTPDNAIETAQQLRLTGIPVSVQVISGCAHLSSVQDPEQVSKVLLNFLNTLPIDPV